MDFLLLQADATTVDGVSTETMTLFSLLLKGGWMLVPIGVLFVAAIYIFFERVLTIQKASRINESFLPNIRDYVMNGNIAAAKDLCKRTDSPIARMIEKGISRIGKPLKNIEVSIENVGKLEVFKLERGLSVLATIAGAAPMLGFLGTVTGMIRAFFKMAKAGNQVEIDVLAGGIYEALITTAVGLAVGIIAFISYNLLVSMVDKVVHKMEATSVGFIDLLQEPAS